MKSTISTALIATSSLLAFASAQELFQLDIQKIKRSATSPRNLASLRRRVNTVQANLGNAEQQGLYFANVSVGTPPQPLMLQIDTGSSDAWIPSSSAATCDQNSQTGGCMGGSFDSSASSTFFITGKNEFNISYVDGSGSTGDYFQDTFTINGATVKQFQMGLATQSSIGVGIMGIGYTDSEANVFSGNGTEYPNLPDALVSAGLAPTQAYSLWLNDLDSSTGSVLFGGIDTKKFTGDLISIPVYPSSKNANITSFTVDFTSLQASSGSGTDTLTPDGFSEAAILDSGTTITLLPNALAEQVFNEVGASYDQQLGAVVVPCALAGNSGTINYGFGGAGGPVIKVPMNELVLPLTSESGETPRYKNGNEACQFGIEPASGLPVLFGDTFLRSAYAVYDLANNKIALANTNFNQTESNIVAFESQGAPIPSASAAAATASVTGTATGLPRVDPSATFSSGASSISASSTSTGGLSAASGFQDGSSSSGSSKKGAATSFRAFDWSMVWVIAGSFTMMLAGGGLLVAM